jgi:DNA modification methylase
MKTLPDGCVQTIITSPPYYGLRDYDGGDAEIGGEETPDQYVQKMVEVFREVKRILRDDGTLWLNLGDSYMSAQGCSPPPQTLGGQRDMPTTIPGNRKVQKGLKTKDLIGIPWRVAFALQADGWYLRQDIIWHKPNPMPESVEDRCTKAHEYIFMLSKKSHYYYDHVAIKEPASNWGTRDRSEMRDGTTDPKLKHHGLKGSEWEENPMKNKRSVWTVNTKGYKGAHFAVYPEPLIVPCILAGTSKYGCCSKCGAPYEQVVNHTGNPAGILVHKGVPNTANTAGSSGKKGKPVVHTENGVRLKKGHNPTQYSKSEPTDEWIPTCNCKDTDVVPCTVFDPFTGSGTTAVVALKNNRNYIGTELNPEYVKIAEARIAEEVPQTLEGIFE